jgi:hypothetical protein
MYTMAKFPLPQDLILLIISQVSALEPTTRVSTLKTASLIQRTWTACAQHFLFSTFLMPAFRVEYILKMLFFSSHPHICKHVISIHFFGQRQNVDFQTKDTICWLTAIFPNSVRSLTYQYDDTRDTNAPILSRLIHGFPCLTELMIFNDHPLVPPLEGYVIVPKDLKLRTLSLRCPACTIAEILSVLSTSSCANTLKHISVKHTTVDAQGYETTRSALARFAHLKVLDFDSVKALDTPESTEAWSKIIPFEV